MPTAPVRRGDPSGTCWDRSFPSGPRRAAVWEEALARPVRGPQAPVCPPQSGNEVQVGEKGGCKSCRGSSCRKDCMVTKGRLAAADGCWKDFCTVYSRAGAGELLPHPLSGILSCSDGSLPRPRGPLTRAGSTVHGRCLPLHSRTVRLGFIYLRVRPCPVNT